MNGFVLNTPQGVLMEIEGRPEDTDAFFVAFYEELPPLAQVTSVDSALMKSVGEDDFHIRHSEGQSGKNALISPDVATCEDCRREMLDPNDRRYRYPFTNCTNCGPRYTIIKDIPYDRTATTMSPFKMCEPCNAEYTNPANRRFHAQPNACPVCGPKVFLLDGKGDSVTSDDPTLKTADLLRRGFVLAIKGLGGFHLAVDAANDQAVKRLRARKHREEKPLAVMSPNLDAVRKFARVTPVEKSVLLSIQRPIVLLEALSPPVLAPSVAPDNRYIGAMLPYTPLHHLLLEEFMALVMTSGNLSEEPIAIENDEALQRLDGIADFFLMHNRDIHLRSDDSVVRIRDGETRSIRRSRGYVPVPVFLKKSMPEILAVGGELKNTVCLTKQDRAFVSQHVGDLENIRTLDFFQMTINHLQRILDIEPKAIAHDLHPEYLSTKWALDQPGIETIGVQHHHAHIASVMAEHRLEGPVIGLSCDGTGYGDDGRIWGGEVIVAEYGRFERRGHMDYLPLPGGAGAIREPWRMAASYLHAAFGSEAAGLGLDMLERQDEKQSGLLWQVIEKRISSPLTSSLGRLFDSVAALVGLRDRAAFEGQAAMMLEMCCPEGSFEPYPFDLDTASGTILIMHQPIIRAAVRDLLDGKTKEEISGRFHAAVSAALCEAARRVSENTGIPAVALSGGCFQNRILTDGVSERLAKKGLTVYTHNLIPANDGGLSLGQAVSAGAMLKDMK